MGLFKKYPHLLSIEFLIWDNNEQVEITYKHPDLTSIEFVHLAIYQFAKVAYVCATVSQDFWAILYILDDIENKNLKSLSDEILVNLRAINTDFGSKSETFKTQLFYKTIIQRKIVTKMPFPLNQNKLLRTIPLSFSIAFENSNELDREIMRNAISYQAKLYKKNKDNYRNMRSLIEIPVTVFQYGFDNRNREIG